ncbi:MAG: putative sulfate/molybdate transporter [Candidatus Thiodiazotropha sp. (ex Ctena orbiculata)]|nr:putative sulfate/molybdate transporter [Candidatus Thiodiazotropha taylori]
MFQSFKSQSKHRYLGDLSGAFADLGTFLPIVIGVLTLQKVDPTGLLIGFGLFALVVAAVYRRPIPIQPMKVVAAIVITQSLDAQTIAATGFLLGFSVALLSLLGILDLLARKIPTPVMTGIQLGVGLMLAWTGIGLVIADPWTGIVATGLLFLLLATPLKPFAAIVMVIGACLWSMSTAQNPLTDLNLALHTPGWTSFGWPQLGLSAQTILLPQLSLTLTNAILATAAIASHYFPEDKPHITPARLGLTTGAVNMLLAPFGAFPMCHGAGGLVVQHRFGARTWLAPTLFGITMLALGLLYGPQALQILLLIPLAAVGALLIYAGLDLAWHKSLTTAPPLDLSVILLTGICCAAINVAVGLLIGWGWFLIGRSLFPKKTGAE